MRYVDIIEKKKQGKKLSKEELHFVIQGYVNDEMPDYQMSALLMAICFTGMDEEETAWLCEEMLYSGDIMDLHSVQGCKADKHSTGGVGDKTSLALLPMVASCGVNMAKMSGRGLGFTGGTLDKLEAIEGFRINLSQPEFIAQLQRIHLAIIGQTDCLVPADKKLYALRDVSATVDSIPLIASSIMSKKIAAGSDTILLDVKYGEGAFMHTPQDAEKLAKTMINIGHHFHKDVRALISDMNQPLGNAIGNALEVKEAIATLQGKGPNDFYDLCLQAGSTILVQNHICEDEDSANKRLVEAVQSGRALQKFIEMVEAQGGNIAQIKDPNLLPQAKEVLEITSKQSGVINKLHAMGLGLLAMQLGAGRASKDDRIDPAVGIVLNKKLYDTVTKGDILAYVHINQPLPKHWLEDFYATFSFTQEPIHKEALIYKVLGS